ncbi:MAG: ureidoglycolate lyase [Paracoccaceae bacterium]
MRIAARPLTEAAFAPFGDVLDTARGPDAMINDGLCGRHHDRARIELGGARAGISLFDATPRALPYTFDLLERHPKGSQAFLPSTAHPFLVIVAPDAGGRPGDPLAFMTAPHQGVNLHAGTWHGVLTPLHAPGLFWVIDRIGGAPGDNLEEVRIDPVTVIEVE